MRYLVQQAVGGRSPGQARHRRLVRHPGQEGVEVDLEGVEAARLVAETGWQQVEEPGSPDSQGALPGPPDRGRRAPVQRRGHCVPAGFFRQVSVSVSTDKNPVLDHPWSGSVRLCQMLFSNLPPETRNHHHFCAV